MRKKCVVSSRKGRSNDQAERRQFMHAWRLDGVLRGGVVVGAEEEDDVE
jgi:hypothetical protein